MGLYENLAKVQQELKAPKNQRNTFGNYNYRSCEDILEAAKPLCVKNGLVLTLSDSIEVIAERVYVKATAMVTDVKGDGQASVTAYAREPLDKKGSDASQITGAASSYARKYALNGLFCIDDTKDADATNTHGKEATQNTNSDSHQYAKGEQTISGVNLDDKISAKDLKVLEATLKPNQVKWVLGQFKKEKLADLTNAEFGQVMQSLKAKG